jgi:hypothetical protein
LTVGQVAPDTPPTAPVHAHATKMPVTPAPVSSLIA